MCVVPVVRLVFTRGCKPLLLRSESYRFTEQDMKNVIALNDLSSFGIFPVLPHTWSLYILRPVHRDFCRLQSFHATNCFE